MVDTAAIEQSIGASLAREDWEAAATLAIKSYGPEILGFLVAMERDGERGAEHFAVFCEDLWRGLRHFRGESSFKTWAYCVARNAAHRGQVDAWRKRGVPLSAVPALAELEAQVRTATLTWLKTEKRDALSALRDRLSKEDQMLLVLRVDRKMEWSDAARVMFGNDLGEDELERHVVKLRKRFSRVKSRLVKLARAEGLIGARDEAAGV